MPAVEAFLDTNILLYAASNTPAERSFAKQALELVIGMHFGTSIQVIQEFHVNATGKLKKNISHDKIAVIVDLLAVRPMVIMTLSLFRRAVRISERFQIGYWDAAIVAAAQELGATTLYSEDLNHGQDYEGLKVINPFHGLR